jgi:signal transduction histidine kinase
MAWCRESNAMPPLAASDQWLELLSEPAALISHPDGVVLGANVRFAAALRSELAAVTGAGLSHLVGIDDAARLAALLADEAGAHPAAVALRFPTSGSTDAFVLTCQFGPICSGRRLLRLTPAGSGHGLRHAADRVDEGPDEAAGLRQKLAWFREAIDKVGHAVVVFDQQGRLVLCNKFYRDGYRSGDRVLPADIALEGKTYRELMELRVRYKLHRELADNPDRFIEDRVRRFEDGTDHITLLATGAVVRSQYRRLADGIRVYISTDITELVQKEQQYLTTELAYRTKSQFLANMSHELRTPLNAIIGFSQLIRDAAAGPVDARYRSYADDIHAAGQHLLNLITDILDLSKIEVGRMELREEVVDIADVVDKCRRLVHECAREANQTLEVAIPHDIPYLLADELRLKQIIINLLSNSIKFTRSAGCIRIAASPGTDGGLLLSVKDNGIGMRREDIATALLPFQQIDQGSRDSRDGTGLGLPLARSLTELHGAGFAIESEPGVGTTVTISLPPERVLRRDRWPTRAASV